MTFEQPIDAPPVGRDIVFHSGHALGMATIQRFAAAIGDQNPLYWDENYARQTPYGGISAPPTLIFEVNHNVRGALGADGFVRQLADFLAPLGLPERAGNEYEMRQPVRPDDVLTLRRRIVDVGEKQGKTGRVVFVSSEITYTNQRGEVLGSDRETMVGRQRQATARAAEAPGLDGGGASAAPETDTEIPRLVVPVTPVLTAMYCAVTWDFARLHYDSAFAQSEGFRERVVDPQMYGSFLARLLTEWAAPAGRLRRLRLSYRAPAYVGDTLICRGDVARRYEQDGEQHVDCDLVVANQHGQPLVRGAAAIALATLNRPISYL